MTNVPQMDRCFPFLQASNFFTFHSAGVGSVRKTESETKKEQNLREQSPFNKRAPSKSHKCCDADQQQKGNEWQCASRRLFWKENEAVSKVDVESCNQWSNTAHSLWVFDQKHIGHHGYSKGHKLFTQTQNVAFFAPLHFLRLTLRNEEQSIFFRNRHQSKKWVRNWKKVTLGELDVSFPTGFGPAWFSCFGKQTKHWDFTLLSRTIQLLFEVFSRPCSWKSINSVHMYKKPKVQLWQLCDHCLQCRGFVRLPAAWQLVQNMGLFWEVSLLPLCTAFCRSIWFPVQLCIYQHNKRSQVTHRI